MKFLISLFFLLFCPLILWAAVIDHIQCSVTIKDKDSTFKNTHTVEFQSPRISRVQGEWRYYESTSKSRSKVSGQQYQLGFSYLIRSVHAVIGSDARHKICTSYRLDICKQGICQEEVFLCEDPGDPSQEGSGWSKVPMKKGTAEFSSEQLPQSLTGQFQFNGERAGTFMLACEHKGTERESGNLHFFGTEPEQIQNETH